MECGGTPSSDQAKPRNDDTPFDSISHTGTQEGIDHIPSHIWIIRYDAVDAELEQSLHFGAIVYRPRDDEHAMVMCGVHELGINEIVARAVDLGPKPEAFEVRGIAVVVADEEGQPERRVQLPQYPERARVEGLHIRAIQ